jgi:hypothetical protein
LKKARKENQMMDYFPMLLGVVSLLVAMWVPLTSGDRGVEAKRVLAWCVVILATLIIPTALLTWVAMQISARLLAPTAKDISSFITQIAWSVGAFSALYPLIWGVKFYPRLDGWISGLIAYPAPAKEKKPTDHQTNKEEES